MKKRRKWRNDGKSVASDQYELRRKKAQRRGFSIEESEQPPVSKAANSLSNCIKYSNAAGMSDLGIAGE